MKKIFMQEWMATRPYRVADGADTYYVGIANKVAAILQSNISDSIITDHHRRYIGLYISSWFEDIISNIGMWKAFTDECQRRYGYRVPLYPMGEDYYPDEVNEPDVRFLLWHYLQVLCIDKKIISPDDPHIEVAAAAIYSLLSAEYEVAPENESLQKAFFGYAFGPDDCSRYCDFLRWFHFRGYLNCLNLDAFHQEMEASIAARGRLSSQLEMNVLQHSLMTNSELFNRLDILSLTSPEWLARIGAGHPETEAWTTVKVSPCHYFLYVRQDEESVYLKDLVTDVEEEIPVKRQSIDPVQLEKAVADETIFVTSLIQYMGVWYQRGLLIGVEKTNPKVVTEVAQSGNIYDCVREKADYQKFMQVTEGKPFVFFKTKEELDEFLTQQLGIVSEQQSSWKVDEQKGAVVMAAPEVGIHVQLDLADCLKSPDNTLYNEASARKNALSFMVSPSVVPYSLSCALQDAGMLDDAMMNSRKGDQYGAELLRRYGRFLTDYYYQQCREKDLDK